MKKSSGIYSTAKRLVWNIKKGNRRNADYRTTFHNAAADLCPDIDYRAKDKMLVDTFTQGLNHSYKKALLMRSPTTLEHEGKNITGI